MDVDRKNINVASLKQQPKQLNLGITECSNYLNPGKWGYFAICRKRQGKRFGQQFYQLREMPQVLNLIEHDTESDYWISQAVFTKHNRRKVSVAHVGVTFVDIDYYNHPELCELSPEQMLELVFRFCEQHNIPTPSLIVDSGQGFHLKWFHEALPKKALVRWDYLEGWLVNLFSTIGSDKAVKDVSRILRVVGTVNQKTQLRSRLQWVNIEAFEQEPKRYEFNSLIAQVHVVVNEKAAQKRIEARQKLKQIITPLKISRSEDSLNWARMCDLQSLCRMRGDMGDGLREPMAFYLCNFFALRHYRTLALRPLDEWAEFAELCRTVAPHWNGAKVREKTSNLYQLTRDTAAGKTLSYRGREYVPLYTPKNEYLIDLFNISSQEQREMSTIIDDTEARRRKQVRDQKRWKQTRTEYEGQAQSNRSEAIRLRNEGMSQRAIAKQLGISRGAVEHYLR